MSESTAMGALERRQARLVRRMMLLSLLFHGGFLMLAPRLAPLFPDTAIPAAVIVELTDPSPMTELPAAIAPPPAAATDRPVKTAPGPAGPPARPGATRPPPAQKWLARLDAALPGLPDAPARIGKGRPGDIPVRRWETGTPPRESDFAPSIAPENAGELDRKIRDLEGRVRSGGGIGGGSVAGQEREAAMMFGQTGDSPGEPLPAWIRDMISRRVRDYLPELQGAYSAALLKNPRLAGRLLVRFRIDPSGKIEKVDPVDASYRDQAFTAIVVEKVRKWTFKPLAGRSVDVLYPFIFVAPS